MWFGPITWVEMVAYDEALRRTTGAGLTLADMVAIQELDEVVRAVIANKPENVALLNPSSASKKTAGAGPTIRNERSPEDSEGIGSMLRSLKGPRDGGRRKR